MAPLFVHLLWLAFKIFSPVEKSIPRSILSQRDSRVGFEILSIYSPASLWILCIQDERVNLWDLKQKGKSPNNSIAAARQFPSQIQPQKNGTQLNTTDLICLTQPGNAQVSDPKQARPLVGLLLNHNPQHHPPLCPTARCTHTRVIVDIVPPFGFHRHDHQKQQWDNTVNHSQKSELMKSQWLCTRCWIEGDVGYSRVVLVLSLRQEEVGR